MNALLATALLAAGFVLFALKTLGAELDYAQRWKALREEADQVRERQTERLRNLRPRRG